MNANNGDANNRARDEPPRSGYRRATGSPRGEARRRELLDRVTDDLAENGLADFSLRRAARAASTTHKVLLYYFDGPDDLLRQAVFRLRDRRISNGLAVVDEIGSGQTLAARVRSLWPVLTGEGSLVLDQAIGLTLYDPGRHADLGREATQQYLPSLLSLCPPGWSPERKVEVSQLILATLRGFLIDWRISGEASGLNAGFEALARALDREEASHG